MTNLDLNAIQARYDAAFGPWWRDRDRQLSAADVPSLLARVRELEAKNTTLGVQAARTADALDRVAVYATELTSYDDGTIGHTVGRKITELITTNPLPSEQGGR